MTKLFVILLVPLFLTGCASTCITILGGEGATGNIEATGFAEVVLSGPFAYQKIGRPCASGTNVMTPEEMVSVLGSMEKS